jgi:hypothetical protein
VCQTLSQAHVPRFFEHRNWDKLFKLPDGLQLFFAAMFGGALFYAAYRVRSWQPFSILRALGVQLEQPWKVFADMIISAAVGATLVMVALNPCSALEALFSGLSWTAGSYRSMGTRHEAHRA